MTYRSLMKKIVLPTLMLAMTLVGTSAFAEQEHENERGQSSGNYYENIYKNSGVLNSLLRGGHSNDDDDEDDDSNYRLSADVRIPGAPDISRVSPTKERSEGLYFTSSRYMQSRASQMIRERVYSLNANIGAINGSKTLTTEQKTGLTSILSTNVIALNALSATIATSTDATTTKALIQSITTNFRIYGVIIPKVRLEKRIYDLQNHAQKLSDLFIQVQTKINEAKAQGKDVTVWQKNLEDVKIRTATDLGLLASAFTKVQSLVPSDYEATSTLIIEQTNATLKTVATDFNYISRNLHRPYYMRNATSTATSTVPTTPTPPTPPATGSTTVSVGYTSAQVATHTTRDNCWIIISGKVYSVSSYISMHPGGSTAILNQCGKDATAAFNTRGGTGTHSSSARSTLGGFFVGNLI